jgi:cytosine/adenosine deaminase-related metal-dependent hydrolase
MTENHYDFAASHWNDISYVLCPLSNMFIASALPPVEMLRRKNAHIALGTDSFASHPSLMMMDDLILLQNYFPDIPLEEILQWATLNGAQSLGVADKLGSIEPGKQPGLVWIEGATYLPYVQLTAEAKAQRLV